MEEHGVQPLGAWRHCVNRQLLDISWTTGTHVFNVAISLMGMVLNSPTVATVKW